MIKVKHLVTDRHPDDGLRLWIEPTILAKDITELYNVDHHLIKAVPPLKLFDSFNNNEISYIKFAARYFNYLNSLPLGIQGAFRNFLVSRRMKLNVDLR